MALLILILRVGTAVHPSFPALGTTHYEISQSSFAHLLSSAVVLQAENRIETSDLRLDLHNSLFTSCTAFRGGAINAKSSQMVLKFCQFKNNSANYAGAVLASNLQTGKLDSVTFFENFAVNLGASFFLDSALRGFQPLKIGKTNVTYGLSASVGGLECWGGLPQVSLSIIDHCTSTFAHPAVRVSSKLKPSLFSNTLFSNNTSRQKGAAVEIHIYQGIAKFDGCIFIGNRQNGTNGTSIFTENTECEVELIDCVLYGEKQRQFGGFQKTKWVKLTRVTFVYDPIKDFMNDTPAPTRTRDCKTCSDWVGKIGRPV
jgi:hypothetical protein